MLRSTSCLTLLSLCLFAHATVAVAQQPAPAQPPRPSQAPPQLERIEPGSDAPTTTIPPRERTRITERRSNDGTVTEVEVQSGKSRYIMKPNVQAGNSQPGDVTSNAIRAPQWQILEFDLGKPKKNEADEQANAAPSPAAPKAGVPARADAPPPPRLEPTEKK